MVPTFVFPYFQCPFCSFNIPFVANWCHRWKRSLYICVLISHASMLKLQHLVDDVMHVSSPCSPHPTPGCIASPHLLPQWHHRSSLLFLEWQKGLQRRMLCSFWVCAQPQVTGLASQCSNAAFAILNIPCAHPFPKLLYYFLLLFLMEKGGTLSCIFASMYLCGYMRVIGLVGLGINWIYKCTSIESSS